MLSFPLSPHAVVVAAEKLPALAGGFLVPVVVAVGAGRARLGFPASALPHDRDVPGH